MADDFEGLAKSIKVFVKETDKDIAKTMIQITTNIHRFLVEGSPVDTGFMRGNWLVNAGEPRVALIGDPKTKSGIQNQSATTAAGAAAALRYRRGVTMYITSAVPYIKKLNSNGSTKAKDASGRTAPRGWVDIAIKKGVDRSGRVRRVIGGG